MYGSVITSCEFKCLHVRICNNILRSSERRPCSVNAGCTRPWSQVVYATAWIMCTSMKHDMFFRASRRNTTKSPKKYAILDDTPTPVRMYFCVRHRVCRSWSWVKLLCLCARLRLGVVPTYYPVNSWSSRSSSCEESLFPCQFGCRYAILCRPKISRKIVLKTSSETHLVGGPSKNCFFKLY
jgi:hypothetical protein